MTAINDVTKLDVIENVGVLTLNSPPVNALSANVREGLDIGIKKAIENNDVQAIVIICEGRTFIAGADISEFGKEPKGPSLFEVQDIMENSPKPLIAAIHGTALGGGLEVALTCHYRIAVKSAKCGLPEVNLGLLPGAGGTQRLPRLVGVEQALKMVTSGLHLPAEQCLQNGLIDKLANNDDLLNDSISFAKEIIEENRPLKKVRDINEKVKAARGNDELFQNFRKSIERKTRGFLAPEYNIQCIEAAVNKPFDEGIKVEKDLFIKLISGNQSAAQRYFFFAQRQVAKIPDIPKETELLNINKVGIIGAGTMGGGIAMNFANAGIPVTIIEQNQERLDKGIGIIRKNYENTAAKGRISLEDVDKRMQFIDGNISIDSLSDKDLIIEAVFENMDLKKEIFSKIDLIAKDSAILATNTSALNINEIAKTTKRPENVIGLHFFSPANVMRLLEVVRGKDSSDETMATVMSLGKKIGKAAVVSLNAPGFIGNRMLAGYTYQANMLLLEGALPSQVDNALESFGMSMGPFRMLDLVGLDLGWRARKLANIETPLVNKISDELCERDRFGQKNSRGFYNYSEGSRAPNPDPENEEIYKEISAKNRLVNEDVK